MSLLKYSGITKWVAFLKANAILCCAIGVSRDDVPGVGSHYDFINRLWLENPEIEQKRQAKRHNTQYIFATLREMEGNDMDETLSQFMDLLLLEVKKQGYGSFLKK